jgi:hypothetical protein
MLLDDEHDEHDADGADSDPDTEDRDEDVTHVGLPRMRLVVHEPTGGGGGILQANARRCQLTAIQCELMSLLIDRMRSEDGESEIIRGFVRSSELIGSLSWETPSPSENHLKQLIRRTRRSLEKADIGNIIESRHRLGYRLKALP